MNSTNSTIHKYNSFQNYIYLKHNLELFHTNMRNANLIILYRRVGF